MKKIKPVYVKFWPWLIVMAETTGSVCPKSDPRQKKQSKTSKLTCGCIRNQYLNTFCCFSAPHNLRVKTSRQRFEFNGCINGAGLHRPAGRCVLFHWAAALSAGAHTGWWSGRSPRPEHSPVDQIEGEQRLKKQKPNNRQWAACKEEERLKSGECRAEWGKSRCGYVTENERKSVKQME